MKRIACQIGLSALVLLTMPSCLSTVGVGRIFMALESDGLRRRENFDARAQTIACVADISAGVDGVTIEFEISRKIEDGGKNAASKYSKPFATAEFVTRKETVEQRVALEWPIEKDAAGNVKDRTVGAYRCIIRADGTPISTGNGLLYFYVLPTRAESPT
jgi:hypothetical protein